MRRLAVVFLLAVVVFSLGCDFSGVPTEAPQKKTETSQETPIAVEDKEVISSIQRPSAIEDATRYRASDKGWRKLKSEAKTYGILLMSSREERYSLFRQRLLANIQLGAAFREARSVEVAVFLKEEFRVLTGFVYVNVGADDREIITFLGRSIPEAAAREVAFDKVAEEARTFFGLHLRSADEQRYREIRERLFANKKLAGAFLASRKADVTIFFANRFYVGRGWVDVDVRASDEEIITFLLGEKKSQ